MRINRIFEKVHQTLQEPATQAAHDRPCLLTQIRATEPPLRIKAQFRPPLTKAPPVTVLLLPRVAQLRGGSHHHNQPVDRPVEFPLLPQFHIFLARVVQAGRGGVGVCREVHIMSS